MRVEGKIALISGAARGFGRAATVLLAAEAAHVFVTDLDDEAGSALAAGLERATYRHLDVRIESQWSETVGEILRRFGRLDILVNNAGIQPGSEYAIKAMRWSGGGSITNISTHSCPPYDDVTGGRHFNTSVNKQ